LRAACRGRCDGHSGVYPKRWGPAQTSRPVGPRARGQAARSAHGNHSRGNSSTDCDRGVPVEEAGLDQMALSLDYPRADLHDGFRGVPGAFNKTMAAVEWAHQCGLPLQINTTLWAGSAPFLSEMAELVERLGAVFWEVFFL